MVTERVGDGDFNLKDCHTVNEVYVNGGGSESVHIISTIVEKLSVNKNNVRVKLDEAAQVAKAYILQNCKLDSEDAEAVFKNVVVANTVTELKLAGKTNIEKIVSNAEGNSTSTAVTVEGTTVKIEAADDAIKNSVTSNGYTAPQGTVDTTDKGDLTEDFDQVVEDSNKTPETPSDVEPDPFTSLAAQKAPSANLRTATLEKQETTEGILVKAKIPYGVDHYTVFIDGIGRIYWNGIYNGETEDLFLFPYVKPGKEYTLRFVFAKPKRNTNDFEIGEEVIAWDDITVKANGGLGEAFFTSSPKAEVSKDGKLKIAVEPEITDASLITDWWYVVQAYEGDIWDKETKYGHQWRDAKEIEAEETYSLTELFGFIPDFVNCLVNYSYKDSNEKEWRYEISGCATEVVLSQDGVSILRVNDAADEDTVGISVSFTIPKMNELSNGSYFYKVFVYDNKGEALPVDYRGLYLSSVKEDTEFLFTYPFVTDGKKYTVKVAFASEKRNGLGYIIDEYIIGAGEKDVTAKNGLGEVAVTYPEVTVDGNGNLKFTTKPTVTNSHVEKWKVEVQAYEGESWMKEDNTGHKYRGYVQIDPKDLDNGISLIEKFGVIPDFVSCKVNYYDGEYVYYSTFGNATDKIVLGGSVETAKGILDIKDKTTNGTKGILVEFKVPEFTDESCPYRLLVGGVNDELTNAQIVHADSISRYYYDNGIQVSNIGKTKQIYYPYVNDGKEYKVKIVFLKTYEDINGWETKVDSFIWGEKTVTANGGLGEVTVTTKPKIELNEYGDIEIKTKPVLSNADAVKGWFLQVDAYAGTSWEHEGDYSRKWQSPVWIPNETFGKKTYNIYLDKPEWAEIKFPIDFVAAQPKISYKDDNGNYWTYQFQPSVTLDVSLPLEAIMLERATLSNLAGKWKTVEERNLYLDGYYIKSVTEILLDIDSDGKAVMEETETISNVDGTAFTDKQKECFGIGEHYTLSDDGNSATQISEPHEYDYAKDLQSIKVLKGGKKFVDDGMVFVKQQD